MKAINIAFDKLLLSYSIVNDKPILPLSNYPMRNVTSDVHYTNLTSKQVIILACLVTAKEYQLKLRFFYGCILCSAIEHINPSSNCELCPNNAFRIIDDVIPCRTRPIRFNVARCLSSDQRTVVVNFFNRTAEYLDKLQEKHFEKELSKNVLKKIKSIFDEEYIKVFNNKPKSIESNDIYH